MNGYERIKELYLNSQNKYKSLARIVKHLMMKENMDDKYLIESKNLVNMMKYINMKAKELAVDNVAVVEDTDVYNWADAYFTESDNVLGFELDNTTKKVDKKMKNKPIDEDKKQMNLEI